MRLCLVLTAFGVLAAADFSGTWRLDPTRSDFGKATPPKAQEMEVQITGDTVTVKAVVIDQRGPSKSQYSLDTSGKETRNSIRGSEVVSMASWRGATLRVKSRTTVQNVEVKTVDEWQLDPATNSLTIYRTATLPNGEIEQKFVYGKVSAAP